MSGIESQGKRNHMVKMKSTAKAMQKQRKGKAEANQNPNIHKSTAVKKQGKHTATKKITTVSHIFF